MKTNVDSQEIQKFDTISELWWQPDGPFKPLHDLNPFRVKFIEQHVDLKNKILVDIGCGGGILTEALALAGASATGIDMSPGAITTAQQHANQHQVSVTYKQISAEDYAQQFAGTADIVTCMELIEHVPDPVSLVQACATLLKPGGELFISTLNRNLKSYLYAIVGAEYLLKLIPKGTHDYAKFIRPSELNQWATAANTALQDMTGITYNPLNKTYKLTSDVSVNYIIYFRKNSE